MSQKNHLFIGWSTDLDELSETLDRHGETISYLKIGSACVDEVDVERVCKMVKDSHISVCIGGGIAEKTPKSGWNRFKKLKELSKRGISGIELPVEVLNDNDIVRLAGDYFKRRLIEVGTKAMCDDPENSPSEFIKGLETAEKFKPDHIVLEGSLSGARGIYHYDTLPNILIVDSVMERISNTSRCIIEGPLKQQGDLWRSVYGEETHIGNIEDFETINTPNELNSPQGYWQPLREFRKRLQKLVEENDLSWDIVATNHKLNSSILFSFPELVSLDDDKLMEYVRYGIAPDPLMGLLRQLMGSMMSGNGIMSLGGGVHVLRTNRSSSRD